jgi:phenylacetate-coenzyme A ligase PaaK-like adenylate-forming protein
MVALIKEERYLVRIGSNEFVLRPRLLISGNEVWPDRWQVDVAESAGIQAKRFYGETSMQVAARAAKHLALCVEGASDEN